MGIALFLTLAFFFGETVPEYKERMHIGLRIFTLFNIQWQKYLRKDQWVSNWKQAEY